MTSTTAPTRPPVRWWPAALVLALLGCYWVWVWNFHPGHRQDKNLQTMASFGLALILLLLWALLYSRFRARVRLLVLGSAVLLVLFFTQALRIRGVTGDLLPILQWRWTKPVATPVAEGVASPPASEVETDYSQFLGPQGNGIVQGPLLARDWKAQPPLELWRQPIGPGWAGYAILNGYAVTLEQSGEQELTTCRDLITGRLLWSYADTARFSSVLAGEGPRTVPTIRSNRVYTVGATGNLNCLDLADGALRWSTNILQDAGSSLPDWGISCSPLVSGNRVIVCAGGSNGQSLIAYNSETGERIWAGGGNRAHYSSPVPATLAGVPQILMFNAHGVSAHDDRTGQVLWGHDWRGGHPHVANPLPLPGDRVLISSGYGTGSELIQITHHDAADWTVQRVWKSNRLKSKFANLIRFDDHIYGLDDGILVCVELATGELMWKDGRYGHGQLILVNDLLLIMAESGEVVLVEPTPAEHRELTRFEALFSKTWNPPALAGPYLLVRNDKETACFELPTQP